MSWSLSRKQLRRDGPFLGTAEFDDQTALLRFLDKEEMREVESEIFLSQCSRRLLQCSTLSICVDGRELAGFISTLPVSQLLSSFRHRIIRLQMIQTPKHTTQISLRGQNQQISLEEQHCNLEKCQQWWDSTYSPGMGSEVQCSQFSGTVRDNALQNVASFTMRQIGQLLVGVTSLASSGNFYIRSIGSFILSL